jgi:hypothetical protein
MIDVRDLVEDVPPPSIVLSPATSGRCASGVVVPSGATERKAALDLEFRMSVRREEPQDLDPDDDGDGIQNDTDTCPLVANPPSDCDSMPATPDEQCDDPCEEDDDRDGIVNGLDNCAWVPNPDQAGEVIGDACTEQVAQVVLNGSATLVFRSLRFDFVQPEDRGSLVVVDLDNLRTLSCPDWASGTCTLDPAAVRVCSATDSLTALAGCN